MSPRVGLFDYGSGNLHSAARAFENAGAEVTVSGDLEALRRQDALVVPGVGAFEACMSALVQAGGADLIRDWAAADRPLFGICVGHQVLFDGGEEHGAQTEGVGLYPGRVTQLAARRLPHMGWNTVDAPEGSELFRGLNGSRFYFVHSYAAHPWEGDARVATCTVEEDTFVAAVERGSVVSTQFHPEKSGASGARLLRNWIATV